MDKKVLFIAVISTILIFVLGIWLLNRNQSSIAISIPDQPVLYYGNTCPHCKDLDELIKKNNIKEKVSFIEKEVFDNRPNAQELSAVAKNCGLDQANVGVPFLYAEGKCLIGTEDIFAYLAQKPTPGVE